MMRIVAVVNMFILKYIGYTYIIIIHVYTFLSTLCHQGYILSNVHKAVQVRLNVVCTCSGSPCVYKLSGVPDKLCVFPANES